VFFIITKLPQFNTNLFQFLLFYKSVGLMCIKVGAEAEAGVKAANAGGAFIFLPGVSTAL
jgi:hypothetical protein